MSHQVHTQSLTKPSLTSLNPSRVTDHDCRRDFRQPSPNSMEAEVRKGTRGRAAQTYIMPFNSRELYV